MILVNQLPQKERINECLIYYPEGGSLIWRERPLHHFHRAADQITFNKKRAGTVAGTKHYVDGSPRAIQIMLDRKVFKAHRLIFDIMEVDIEHGFYIDHRDGNPFNNQWSNLRTATHSQNLGNRRPVPNRKHLLPKGVHRARGGKFRAVITINYRFIHIGTYLTPELAHAAYCAKAVELFGDFARFH